MLFGATPPFTISFYSSPLYIQYTMLFIFEAFNLKEILL